jgi:REP element-mobilizing transposase RayT
MTNYEWDDNQFPLAYLITVRTYGTWLHGDERGSVDRHGKNIYGTPRIAANAQLKSLMTKEMASDPFILTSQIKTVDTEIRDVCEKRKYLLRALNVRTNHFHAVVSAQVKPLSIIGAFKSNATRTLREKDLVSRDRIVWSLGRSRRYLWKPRDVELAIDYAINRQGGDLLESFDSWMDRNA